MSRLYELFPMAESLLELSRQTLAPISLRIGAGARSKAACFGRQTCYK